MAKYSKHVGVTFDKRRNKWIAAIKHNGRQKFLGYFDTEQDAYQKRLLTEHEMKDVLYKNIREQYSKELTELYNSGYTISQLADHYKKDYSTIYESLKNLNIELRDDLNILNKTQKSDILNSYLSGKHTRELATEYGVKLDTVYRSLKKSTKIRPYKKHPLIDDNFLKFIDCEWKAYFLGLLWADGNMRKLDGKKNNSCSVSISLTELVKHKQADYNKFREFIYKDATIFLERKKNRTKK